MAFLEFDLDGNQSKVELQKETTMIGRATEADLRFEDDEMSRKHCSIIQKDGKFFVRDENATNGTFLNDQLLNASELYELKNEDELRVGNTYLTFRA
ncbi:MAG: FHA domain-containing protein [Victivallales bacterium]|nr:FHA domain-containing protein [Victivallales bacterium]